MADLNTSRIRVTTWSWSGKPTWVQLDNLGGADKFGIQILNENGDIIAQLEQSANNEGKANFNIQKILQSLVNEGDPLVENLGSSTSFTGATADQLDLLSVTRGEMANYKISYGTITGGVYTEDGINPSVETTYLQVCSGLGRDDFYQLDNPYDPTFQNSLTLGEERDPCIVNLYDGRRRALAMSDWDYSVLVSDLPGAAPEYADSNQYEKVWVRNVTLDDYYTLTYCQNFTINSGIIYNYGYPQIEYFQVELYDQFDTLMYEYQIPNIQRNGGGPAEDTTDPFASFLFKAPDSMITVGCGPKNLQDSVYYEASTGSPTLITGIDGAAYYYVYPMVKQPFDCQSTNVAAIYRFNIVQPECLDYPHSQLSWQNREGFRDYFTVTKKIERKVSINNNDFLQDQYDYQSSDPWYTNEWSRGYKTASQQLEQEYVITTGYMTDQEAKFLENMFTSPDIKLRFSAETDPVQPYELVPFSTYDTTGQLFRPIVITGKSYTERTYRKDRLFQYEIRFKLAHPKKSIIG
jgi:hypothetical protein